MSRRERGGEGGEREGGEGRGGERLMEGEGSEEMRGRGDE